MEEGRYHYHHHHGHENSNVYEGHGSQLEINSQGRSSDQQQRYVIQPAPPTVTVPRPHEQTSSGVQATGSFHSVSSIDSSAEMARYFPDPQTPTLSPFRYPKNGQRVQSAATTSTIGTSSINIGPYAPPLVPAAVEPPLHHPIRAPIVIPQQQPTHSPAAPQLPPGIPSYSSQIEGLSVAQAIVNDVIVDLQSKVINETQLQYNNESVNGNFLEALSPIYIRAPNPTIILRSDLHRLRAQLTARPAGAAVRPSGGINQFQQNTYQVPSFPPPPQQHVPPECYGEYQNKTYVNT